MKEEPKVLTRMRLSCCWGDNLSEKELNEVVDYINNLQSQLKAKEEVIKEAREVISKMISIGYIVENGATAIQYIPTGKKTEFYPRAKIIDEILSKGENK